MASTISIIQMKCWEGSMVDQVFKRLERSKSIFSLVKIESNGRISFISKGRGVVGSLHIVHFEDNMYGIKVQGRGFDYIRTSPVVEVVKKTKNTVVFKTMGGTYKLEKVK